jgi:hypothetical protein
MAMLLDSVAPDVQRISFASAPTSCPSWARAFSTAAFARYPKEWLREAAFPKYSVKNGNIASTTRGSQGVVAWLSR